MKSIFLALTTAFDASVVNKKELSAKYPQCHLVILPTKDWSRFDFELEKSQMLGTEDLSEIIISAHGFPDNPRMFQGDNKSIQYSIAEIIYIIESFLSLSKSASVLIRLQICHSADCVFYSSKGFVIADRAESAAGFIQKKLSKSLSPKVVRVIGYTGRAYSRRNMDFIVGLGIGDTIYQAILYKAYISGDLKVFDDIYAILYVASINKQFEMLARMALGSRVYIYNSLGNREVADEYLRLLTVLGDSECKARNAAEYLAERTKILGGIGILNYESVIFPRYFGQVLFFDNGYKESSIDLSELRLSFY